MKKYTLIYELEIEAEDIDEAEELAEAKDEEFKKKATLKAIKGKDESLERFSEG